jgi:hypothetical protein
MSTSFISIKTGPTDNNPKNTAFYIFLSAEAFYKTYLLANENSNGSLVMHLNYAALANNAFACELYLKSLYYLENECNAPIIHKLSELYLKLSKGAQDKIKVHYVSVITEDINKQIDGIKASLSHVPNIATMNFSPVLDDIMDVLSKGAHGFQTFRYAFQYVNSQPYEYDVEPIVKAIRRYINEISPNWFALIQTPIE